MLLLRLSESCLLITGISCLRGYSLIGLMMFHYETTQWDPHVIMSALICRWNLHRSSTSSSRWAMRQRVWPVRTHTHTQAVKPSFLSIPDAQLSTLYLSWGVMCAVVVLEKQGLGTTNPLLKQITQQGRWLQRFNRVYNSSQIRKLEKSGIICLKNGCAFDL